MLPILVQNQQFCSHTAPRAPLRGACLLWESFRGLLPKASGCPDTGGLPAPAPAPAALPGLPDGRPSSSAVPALARGEVKEKGEEAYPDDQAEHLLAEQVTRSCREQVGS